MRSNYTSPLGSQLRGHAYLERTRYGSLYRLSVDSLALLAIGCRPVYPLGMWYVAEDCLVHVAIDGHVEEVREFIDFRLCMQGSDPVRLAFQDAPVWGKDQRYTLSQWCLPQDYLAYNHEKGTLLYTNKAGEVRRFVVNTLLLDRTTPAIARALLVGWPMEVEDHFVGWALTEMRKVLELRAEALRTRYENDLL